MKVSTKGELRGMKVSHSRVRRGAGASISAWCSATSKAAIHLEIWTQVYNWENIENIGKYGVKSINWENIGNIGKIWSQVYNWENIGIIVIRRFGRELT